jgi:hypothetical protein
MTKTEDALFLAASAVVRDLSRNNELAARIGKAVAHDCRFELRIRDVLGEQPEIVLHTIMPDGSEGRPLCQLTLGEDDA